MTRAEAIVKALATRGETEVTHGSATKFRKFTRRYAGRRDADGTLVRVASSETFWFVSGYGSLRVGVTSTGSRRAKPEIVNLLIEEGRSK
jgi:hypothetical protein